MKVKSIKKILVIIFLLSGSILISILALDLKVDWFNVKVLFWISIYSLIFIIFTSNIKKIYKILIFILTLWFFYNSFVEHPTRVEYQLFFDFDENNGGEFKLPENQNILLQNEYILKNHNNVYEIWVKEKIEEIEVYVGGGEMYDYDHEGRGGKIQRKYLKIKVDGAEIGSYNFKLKINQENGKQQTHTLDLSWHGGVFWETFPEKYTLKTYWVDQEKFESVKNSILQAQE